jgi:hypothetical protein
MYITAKAATFDTLKEIKGELSLEEFTNLYRVVRHGIVTVRKFDVKDGLQSDDDIYAEYQSLLASFEIDNHG